MDRARDRHGRSPFGRRAHRRTDIGGQPRELLADAAQIGDRVTGQPAVGVRAFGEQAIAGRLGLPNALLGIAERSGGFVALALRCPLPIERVPFGDRTLRHLLSERTLSGQRVVELGSDRGQPLGQLLDAVVVRAGLRLHLASLALRRLASLLLPP